MAVLYTKTLGTQPNPAQLAEEINTDPTLSGGGKSVAGEGITWTSPNVLLVYMSALLTVGEESALDAVIAAHSAVAGPIEINQAFVQKTTAPTVTDDVPSGYQVGDHWLDIVGDKEYVLVDGTVGAAVWKLTSVPDLDELGDVSTFTGSIVGTTLYYTGSGWDFIPHNLTATTAPTVNDDANDGYRIGSRWVDSVTGRTYVCVDTTVGAAVWSDTSSHTGLTDLTWASSGHTGTASTFAAFTAGGAATNLTTTASGDATGTWPTLQITDLTISGETHGDLLYFNGTNWVRLAPGTAGYLLVTQGAGAAPVWQDADQAISRFFSYSFTSSSGSPYQETTSAAYENIGDFIFPGTSAVDAPTALLATIQLGGGTSMDVRVFDVTNATTIAELIGYTNLAFTIQNLGTLSNITTTPAIWQVQLRGNGGGRKARISAVAGLY